ncbi:hypothetical protein QUW41_10045 [Slackia piriformis]|nr:hypothetical protein [Slackia piriformis]
MTAAMPAAAFAMPGDIQEAVTNQGYNAYEHQSGTAEYDESQLLAIDGNYVATANAMIRKAPFGEILGSVQPGTTYHVVGECPDCMWYAFSCFMTIEEAMEMNGPLECAKQQFCCSI